MSQFFTSGGQSIGVSASASVLPMNFQDGSPLGWIGWISLQSKGPTRVFSSTTVQKHQFKKKGKHQFFGNSAFFMVQLSHPYMTTGKTIALTRQTFVGKVMSLLLLKTDAKLHEPEFRFSGMHEMKCMESKRWETKS